MRQLEEQKVTGPPPPNGVAAVSDSGRPLEVRIDGRAMRGLDHIVIARGVLEPSGAARETMAENLARR